MNHTTKLKVISSLKRRFFSTQPQYPPGLRLIENFLPTSSANTLKNKSMELVEMIGASLQQPSQKVKTTTYLAKQHNLATDDFYQKIRLSDEGGKMLDAQHFAKYGDHGHSLTYFIGTSNVPHYVRSNLIPSLEKLNPPLNENASSSKGTDWRFSFNIYRGTHTQRAGFPWHIDTASNGESTVIYTLLSEAKMELKRPEDSSAVYTVTLPPNSLLVLGGEARWKWQHRVLSENIDAESSAALANETTVKRLSLVLGSAAKSH